MVDLIDETSADQRVEYNGEDPLKRSEEHTSELQSHA